MAIGASDGGEASSHRLLHGAIPASHLQHRNPPTLLQAALCKQGHSEKGGSVVVISKAPKPMVDGGHFFPGCFPIVEPDRKPVSKILFGGSSLQVSLEGCGGTGLWVHDDASGQFSVALSQNEAGDGLEHVKMAAI